MRGCCIRSLTQDTDHAAWKLGTPSPGSAAPQIKPPFISTVAWHSGSGLCRPGFFFFSKRGFNLGQSRLQRTDSSVSNFLQLTLGLCILSQLRRLIVLAITRCRSATPHSIAATPISVVSCAAIKLEPISITSSFTVLIVDTMLA